MEYTVQKLAKLSGISARTLRYYDRIGLLRPARISGNGYRIYGQNEVDMLQNILFYREMEVPLEEIKKIIDSPGFDREKSLEKHLERLMQQRQRIEKLIYNVTKTIESLKGECIMNDKEKFEGFKDNYIEENEKNYGKEVRNAYGDDIIDASNMKIKNMSEEQWLRKDALEREIASLLKEAMESGNPACEKAQKACDLHRQWICMFWKDGTYSKQAHKMLGKMYTNDERFRKYYEDIAEGMAEFFRKALDIYCENN